MTPHLTVAFDADDTLWHNENAFAAAEDQFNKIVAPWADADKAQRVLVDFQRSHLALYGYGVKSFCLSMIAAACDLSDDEIPAAVLRTIVGTADELLAMPTELIDGAAEAIQAVSQKWPTMIITKGDLHHQLRRIDQAGVGQYCFDVEVVANKDAATYKRILERHRIEPENLVMVGNSIVSDVAPLLEIGARSVHIPYAFTWAIETATHDPEPSDRWFRLESISALPNLIESLT
ncbi:MAG: putative hydrolase of the HAD superfamily [Paracrocinitomix sp.]|jgi:putative hydrolase of the HAD superfamily